MLKDNLIKARLAKELTQQDVADYLNVKRQTYSAYERDKSIPDAETLYKLSQLYDVSSDELLGIEKSPSKNDELIDIINKTPQLVELIKKFSKASTDVQDQVIGFLSVYLNKQ